MKTVAQWCDWDGNGLDHCSFFESGDYSILEGVVIGTREEDYGAHYCARTDALFRTREVRVECGGGPRMHVSADGEGRWHDLLRDKPIPSLAGCLDVDIRVSYRCILIP